MKPTSKIALIALTRGGLEKARLLRSRLKQAEIVRPERLGSATSGWERPFTGALSKQIPELFANFDQMVFFLAAGAVTRLLAPCLASKQTDPGVLAVDEAGQFVVPLLSGHQGGANAFARTVAGCLGAVPVITTASDVLAGFSPDLLEEEFGWVVEGAERLKAAAAALVNNAPMALIQELGTPGRWLDERELPANVIAVRATGQLPRQAFEFGLWITDRLVDDPTPLEPERIVWYRPRSLVLGVGCERGISLAALEEGLERFLQEQRLARASIHTVATVSLKADEEAIVALARKHGWEMRFFTPEELAKVSDIPTPSAVVEKCVGTPGVAEPAALLASGATRLLVEKHIHTSPLASQRMTFAVARSAEFESGEKQASKVVFIGAGPGDPDLLTVKARNLLRRADVVVYAGSLIPEAVLQEAAGTAKLVNSAHLTLEQVMECLIEAVRAGKRLVRLQSGDTSIYSAIQEQMTQLDEAGIGYEVVPGISSFQAAAAALRAELTLPEVVQTIVLTRGEGETKMPAAEELAGLARHRATLCIFLSARLADSVEQQLLSAYPPETPTAICHRVSWPDEKIVLAELRNLAVTVKEHQFTRTTLILVGEAVGRRRNRSRLYDKTHGHIFRAPTRLAAIPEGCAGMRPRTPAGLRLNERKSILLLSGTHEGPLLAQALLDAGFAVHATVTRPEARDHLFGGLRERMTVEARGFIEESLSELLGKGEIDIVVDATHPFAVRITRIAQSACARAGTAYIRYERPDWVPPPGTQFVDSFAEAAGVLPKLGRRILLTIGAKQLKHFAHLHAQVTLFARVLPAPVSVQQALDAGFAQDRILALRPPFSREFNEAILKEHRIDMLLTKASGVEGGVREKVLAAQDLGIQVLMIRRPELEDVSAVDTVDAVLRECQRHLDRLQTP
jgi:precorrin-4 C11-methyltransferase/precorrin-6x reductase